MSHYNHHASVVLPFYDDSSRLQLLFEQKSPDYKPPFFDNALNIPGGNSNAQERSAAQVLNREIHEEFGIIEDTPETLDAIIGQKVMEASAELDERLPPQYANMVHDLGKGILENASHAATYEMIFLPPIAPQPIVCSFSVYTSPLDEKTFRSLKRMMLMLNEKLTVDNYKLNSKCAITTIEDINRNNSKIAWGYDHILNDLMEIEFRRSDRIYRPLSIASATPILRGGPAQGPSFDNIKALGHTYKNL
jgi:hypothetical protein